MDDMQLIQGQVLGTSLTGNPHFSDSGRNANALRTQWDNKITPDVVTLAINGIHEMLEGLDNDVSGFQERFSHVIGRENSIDADAFNSLIEYGDNLIQIVSNILKEVRAIPEIVGPIGPQGPPGELIVQREFISSSTLEDGIRLSIENPGDIVFIERGEN